MQACLPGISKYPSTKSQRKFHPPLHSQGEFVIRRDPLLYQFTLAHLFCNFTDIQGTSCQEFLFEEFFSHCTDLALVLCVFRSPRKEETMKTAKTTGSRVLSKDEFQAHATARFEKVMRKLNSATVS